MMARQFEGNLVAEIMGSTPIRPSRPAAAKKAPATSEEPKETKLPKADDKGTKKKTQKKVYQTVNVSRDVYAFLLRAVSDARAEGIHMNQSLLIDEAVQALAALDEIPETIRTDRSDFVVRSFWLTPETWRWLHDESARRKVAGSHQAMISDLIEIALRREMHEQG